MTERLWRSSFFGLMLGQQVGRFLGELFFEPSLNEALVGDATTVSELLDGVEGFGAQAQIDRAGGPFGEDDVKGWLNQRHLVHVVGGVGGIEPVN